jgi:hypothetical protein
MWKRKTFTRCCRAFAADSISQKYWRKIIMLNKKIMSAAMATLMAASAIAPAFAAEGESGESTTNRSLKVEGTYQAVDIAVVVPATGTVIINPYALPVEIGKDADDNPLKVSGQIVTKPMAIKNQSEVALDINVSTTATVKGNLTLATAAVTPATETKNSAFVYLAIEPTTLAGEKDADAVGDGAIAAAYKDQTWTEYGADTANVLALKASTTAVTKSGMGTLTAAKMDESDGTFSAYDEGSIAFVGLTGNCAQSPKTAWTTKDGLTANIAFTFTPHVEAATEEVVEP